MRPEGHVASRRAVKDADCGTAYTGRRDPRRVNLRSAAPARRANAARRSGGSNLDAHLRSIARRRGAHAVEFSKTAAPTREGDAFVGCALAGAFPARDRPPSIAR